MRILLVAESYWPNTDGGATFARRLVHGMIDHGHDMRVWAPGSKFWHSYEEHDGGSLIYREKSFYLLVNPKYRNSYFPFITGYTLLKRIKPEVIHVNLIGWLTIPTMIYAKRHRVPVVAVNHLMAENILDNIGITSDTWFRRLCHRLIWRFLMWFYNACDFVTSPTPYAIATMEHEGLTAPHRAISNGLDTVYYAPGEPEAGMYERLAIPNAIPLIMYLGRTDGEKRIDVLIDAFAKLIESEGRSVAHLVIAGYGNHLEALKDQAKHLEIVKEVTFTGFVSDEDKRSLYRSASIFAIASPAELQSIVLMEAMATGVAVVAVDVAALSELCRDGETGYLFPNGDATALSQRLGELLTDPTKAKAFGMAGRRLIVGKHSNEATIDQFEAVYREVAS